MPLSTAADRERIHTRTIECAGFLRADGLWDIEGVLRDTKTYGYKNQWRGEVEPGEPVHHMAIRMTVDDDFVIRDIEAASDATPYQVCPDAAPGLAVLKGENIGRGWSRTVRRLVGNIKGCTHLNELLGRMATAAYQTIYPYRMRDRETGKITSGKPPPVLNTCHAWRDDGPVIRDYYPEFFAGDKNENPVEN
jgi:hypothetical protein